MDLLPRVLGCFVIFTIVITAVLGGPDPEYDNATEECEKEFGKNTPMGIHGIATIKQMKFTECILRGLKWVIEDCRIDVNQTIAKAEKEAHSMPEVDITLFKEEIRKCADVAESAGDEPCHKKVHQYYKCIILSVEELQKRPTTPSP